MHAFDTDIFAENISPFSAYLEPEGYVLLPKKKPQVASYERCTPETVRIAVRMLANIPYRCRWGLQIETGNWLTKTNLREHTLKSGMTVYDNYLQLINIMRHLSGRTCAVGATDIFLPDQKDYTLENPQGIPIETHVGTLRVDVDMDYAYEHKLFDHICKEIDTEQETAHELGLPYSVFFTGRRGHQIVIALKVPVRRHIASFLLHSYIALLTERAEHGAIIDTHNLKKILRLPGGIHARTNRLGLWIDPETISFYPIEIQAHLMANGFVDTLDREPDILSADKFTTTVLELTAFLKSIGVKRHDELSASEFSRVITELPNNVFVDRFRHGTKNIGDNLPDATTTSKNRKSDTVQVPIQLNESLSTDIQDEAWAKKYFSRGYSEGGFWDYISPDGIKAAIILFKSKTVAEIQLIEQAEQIPYLNPNDLEDRKRSIRRFIETFDINSIRKSESYLTSAYKSLLDHFSEIIDSSSLHSQRRKNIKMVAEIMLLEYQRLESEESADPEWTNILKIELSSRTIAASIIRRFGTKISYRTVLNSIPYLIDSDKCLFSLFHNLGHGVKYRVENDRIPYKIGRDAKEFLKGLSEDNI